MDQSQTRLEDVIAMARELTVLDKVRLLEQVVADLENSLDAIEKRAVAGRENKPD